MADFVPGARVSTSDTGDHVLDIEKGIKYLNPRHNGIRFVKRLLENSSTVAKSFKHEWKETVLPPRREEITCLIGDTDITVVDSSAYPLYTELLIESEVVTITARKDATTITVTRGARGTAAAAHAAKMAINLGYAGAEYGTGPEALSTDALALYNYVETFEQAVEMSDYEIAQLSSEIGNPFSAQLERITAYFWKLFAQVVFKGVAFIGTRDSKTVYNMGGIDSFVTTNVTSVGGALSTTNLDALILDIVEAGGNPTTIVCSPARFQKLSKLDTSAIMIGKDEKRGGDPIYSTWQSAGCENLLDIVVDHSVLDSELYVLDESDLELVPMENNGVSGRLKLVDGTAAGASGKRRILRGMYTLVVHNEKGHGKLVALT